MLFIQIRDLDYWRSRSRRRSIEQLHELLILKWPSVQRPLTDMNRVRSRDERDSNLLTLGLAENAVHIVMSILDLEIVSYRESSGKRKNLKAFAHPAVFANQVRSQRPQVVQ